MYDIALTIAACVRSGTRADVAWMAAPVPSEDALALTPGGGRIGSLCGGAFDGLLADAAARQLPEGRVIQHVVTEFESIASGLPTGTAVEFLVVPAAAFPVDLWPRLMQREAVTITCALDADVVREVSASPAETGSGVSVERDADRLVTHLEPMARLVIAGRGPVAEALARQGELLGWKVATETRPEVVTGLAATLSPLDAIVVMGHDVESSSRCLMAALDSDAGYIGALGSREMQQSRADWLSYRDVTDLSRVHGPAGLPIGGRAPADVAVSIAAEIIAVRHLGE